MKFIHTCTERSKDRNPEAGAIAVLTAVILIPMMILSCLVWFVAIGYNREQDLKQGTVAAAHDGAVGLNGQPTGIDAARTNALAGGRRQALILDGKIGMNDADVDVGYWDNLNKVFHPEGDTVSVGGSNITLSSAWTPQYFNAVKARVSTDGQGSHNKPMSIMFNMSAMPPKVMTQESIALSGGACTADDGCVLPVAIPSCAITSGFGGHGETMCGTTQTLYFNHGHGKDIGLANVVNPDGNVNNSGTRQQMADGAACRNPDLKVGDSLPLGNGNDFNKQVSDKMREPRNIVCAEHFAPYTNCPRESIPVVNVGNCTAPMNHSATVVGFARVVVLATNPSGKDASITVYIDCTQSNQSKTGCANFGYGSKKVARVQ